MSVIQRTFLFLSIAGLLILIYLLRPILSPFLIGILLAYLGDPVVDRLEANRVNRTLGVCVVFLVFGMILVSATLILLPMVGREIAALIREIPNAIVWLQKTTGPFMSEVFGVDPFQVDMDRIKKTLVDNWQQAGGIVGMIIAEVTKSSVALITWVANVCLIPVVAFYIMRDWDKLLQTLRLMLPRGIEKRAVSLVVECDEVLSSFLRGQLLIMVLLGCIYALGLWLVGLELAVIIGLLAGLASIVPYLGFIVGISAATVAALFQFHDLVHLFYVFAVFGIGQILEGVVLTPLLVGDRIGLHPVAVIFAILAGGQLFGFVGVLLALPAAAVVMVFVRHWHDSYLESDLYESEESRASESDTNG